MLVIMRTIRTDRCAQAVREREHDKPCGEAKDGDSYRKIPRKFRKQSEQCDAEQQSRTEGDRNTNALTPGRKQHARNDSGYRGQKSGGQ